MIKRKRQTPMAPLALATAAALVVSVAGGAIVDLLWLALIPAIVLLFIAVGVFHGTSRGRDGLLGILGTAALRAGCIGLLGTAVSGLIVVAVRGVEPTWLSAAALVSGITFVVGELLFGVAAAWRRTAPRGTAILFAIAIPFGLAIDLLPQLVLPTPPFFAGTGVYIGLALLAVSVARLGTAARRPTVTGEVHVERAGVT